MVGMPIRRARKEQKAAEERARLAQAAALGQTLEPQDVETIMEVPVAPAQRPRTRPSGLPDFDYEQEKTNIVEITRQEIPSGTKFGQFSTLTDFALKRAFDILSVKIEKHEPDYLRLLSIQKDTLAAVLSIQTKVDDTALRKLQGDKFGSMLERIRSEQG